MLDNDLTLSSTGLISVRGQVNAVSGAVISAGDIDISGSVETGAEAVVRIDNLVNLSGAMIDMDDVTAMVDLDAVNDIAIAGRIAADGADNQNAGDVSINAGGDIALAEGRISLLMAAVSTVMAAMSSSWQIIAQPYRLGLLSLLMAALLVMAALLNFQHARQ